MNKITIVRRSQVIFTNTKPNFDFCCITLKAFSNGVSRAGSPFRPASALFPRTERRRTKLVSVTAKKETVSRLPHSGKVPTLSFFCEKKSDFEVELDASRLFGPFEFVQFVE
jgi:hypothetical protein